MATPEEFSRFCQQQAMITTCSDGADIGFITEWNPVRLILSLPQTELAKLIITTPEEFSRF